MKIMLSRALLAALLSGSALTMSAVSAPAAAQVGGIVHDPRNYAQNILTAARTLEQINNQIKQLQNQATSLANEARNLSSLPVSTLQEMQSQVDRTRQLLSEAQRVAFDVGDIQTAFDARYKGAGLTGSQGAMVANAEARWKDSVGAFQDAMKVQAGVVANLAGTRQSIGTLVSASQSAAGALQAAQAGNQILAVQSQQLTDIAAALAASARAIDLGRAAKIAVIAVLGGLIMALAILHASSPPASGASAATMTEVDSPITDTAVAERCRTTTVADPECEAAWDAKRRHFFGQKD